MVRPLSLYICVFTGGLLCAACAPEPRPVPIPPTASSGPLRKRLSAGNVRHGVAGIIRRARACGHRHLVTGRYRIRVVISGATGRPIQVTVINSPIHLPTERCLINAFGRARFQRFRDRTQSFIFPIIFR